MHREPALRAALSRVEAARYVGVSMSSFDAMVTARHDASPRERACLPAG